MSKYNQYQDSTDPWVLDESFQIWTLGKNATISVTGEPAIDVSSAITDTLVKLKGDIDAKGAGSEGLHIEGDNTRVQVKSSSLIEARDGIYNNSFESRIENYGTIDAKDRGIASDSGMDVANHGTISADNAIALLGDSTVTNFAGGLIEGDAFAIRISTFGSAKVTNHGQIIADDAALLINSAGNSELNNHGKITGTVSGGDGNDTYTIGKGKFDLSEESDSGYDTVSTQVSHKLRANFEELWLTGSKSIDGTGNAAANMLHGNAADNVLRGKGGHDYLFGGVGDDLLFGGKANDYFIFEAGDDRDTVRDLVIGEDCVALLIDGYDSFDDVAEQISQHGNDTWISLGGGDRIILKNIDADDVNEDVVIFNVPM
jgi:Ca2+-binding RTX toxin-like protein